MNLKHCKDFPDSNCEIEGCKDVATKIIRTKLVCKNCYKILLRDNVYKFDNDIDITDSIEISKSCYKYKCTNKILTILKYDVEGNLNPKYCSEKCETRDKQLLDFYRQSVTDNNI